jgi:hypothetical protein
LTVTIAESVPAESEAGFNVTLTGAEPPGLTDPVVSTANHEEEELSVCADQFRGSVPQLAIVSDWEEAALPAVTVKDRLPGVTLQQGNTVTETATGSWPPLGSFVLKRMVAL